MKVVGITDMTCVVNGITYQAEEELVDGECVGCAGYRDRLCSRLPNCLSPNIVWKVQDKTSVNNQPKETTMDKVNEVPVKVTNQTKFMLAMLAGETVTNGKCAWKMIDDTVTKSSEIYQTLPTDFSDLYIKPRSLTINGVELVPPMCKPPAMGAVYYIADIGTKDFSNNTSWSNDSVDNQWFSRGLAHATKEAAIAHARALLSFTTTEGKSL